MQRLEVSCAVRRIHTSLGAKGLKLFTKMCALQLIIYLSVGKLVFSINSNWPGEKVGKGTNQTVVHVRRLAPVVWY